MDRTGEVLQRPAAEAADAAAKEAKRSQRPEERIEDYLAIDPMEIELGVGQNGTPMTYLHDGKQYVVFPVGGDGLFAPRLGQPKPGAPPPRRSRTARPTCRSSSPTSPATSTRSSARGTSTSRKQNS